MCDEKYHTVLLKTLISRTWELNSTYQLATNGIDIMKTRLLKNGYSSDLIDKNILRVISRKFEQNVTEAKEEKTKTTLFIQYGKGGKELKTALNKLVPNNTLINVVLQTRKVQSLLSTKCATPKECKGNLVYQFKCHGCDSQYIGETKRHLRTRVAEHRRRTGESAIRDHALICDNRQNNISIDEFKIVKQSFRSKLERRFFESLTIQSCPAQ